MRDFSFASGLLAACLIVSGLLAAPAMAVPVRQYSALALSAAGDRIASVEAAADAAAPHPAHGTIVVRSAVDGGVLAMIDPCAACSYAGLVYAPDGALAFLARDMKAGTTRLMLARAGATATLATIAGIAQEPRFSPDGSRIALLVTIGARKEAGATQAGVRQIGEIGTENDAQRIALVATGGGAPTLVSPATRYVYEFDWTPDGRGFVATSAEGNGDANWWVATLDAFDIASGVARRIAAPGVQMNFPRVSPDGRTVAFIGGLMSDFGSVGGDVWTVPIEGGTARDATDGFKGSFTSLRWGRGGLIGSALMGDRAAIVPIDPLRGARAPLWSAPVSIAAGGAHFALSADARTIAAVAQDYETPPAILAGPIAAPRRLTHDNDALPANVRAQSLTWRSGGFEVQGWLLAPAGGAAQAKAERGKMPMLTVVHGGPSAANVPAYLGAGGNADLLAAGYWLFLPNPRGSYGQGEAFTRANIRDFGGGDLRDILAGIDAALKAAPIDTARLGLMGGSYGGFMAMWANTQTTRFKAIWSAAGLSDWVSYYGTNGINTWMTPFFGKTMYDDIEAYRRVSAVDAIKAAKTPTLITVGERDIEVPPTQSVEYWNALKAMGVPTSLVIYPDEGHAIRDPGHAADVRKRVMAWFDRYLK